MTKRSTSTLVALAAVAGALVVVPAMVGAEDGDGFDGYIQSGTCAAPTDDLRVKLDSESDDDVEAYEAIDPSGSVVTLGYVGVPEVSGFGLAAIYTDQRFSIVVTDPRGAVACGDLLEPDADRFTEAGVAVVQLLPTGGGTVHGVAVVERTTLERELDVVPTRVRIIISTEAPVTAPASSVGFDGFVQSGTCAAPTSDVTSQLRSEGEHDVRPFEALEPETGDAVTVAYYGAASAYSFGLAAVYTDSDFAFVLADSETGTVVSCGDILEPEADRYTEAGVALVHLGPIGDAGVEGYAVIERVALERELDVTPTRIRTVVFAEPVVTS